MKKSFPIFLSLFIGLTPLYANESLNIKIQNKNIDLIKCPAGEFELGSPRDELGRANNSDYDKNNIKILNDFYIGKYEITQDIYQAIMGENPSKNVGSNFPVDRVTYYNAVEFCDKLNKITEKERPEGYEFMLPSEVQWEYACRAGTNTALNNGKNLSNTSANSDELNDIAWYKSNSETKTHAVGLKKPNNWGIFDMHGNVAEWCLDAFNGAEATNVVNNQSKCAIRGGAYFYEPAKLRSASRGANSPNTLSSAFGFRVALVNTATNIPTTETTQTTETTPTIPTAPTTETTETTQATTTTQTTQTTQTIPTTPTNQPEIITKTGEKISISVNGVKFPLIGCAKGEFMMGSPNNEIGRENNETQHKVLIDKGFYIGKYEVTQGQYKSIMGNNPSITIGDKLPVHNLNYFDAQNFCNKLNELTKDKRPAGFEFGIPSEEQWEYACRSGYPTSLNNGKNLQKANSTDNELNKIGWYTINACDKVQTVGKRTANAWGIHDMLGNIWEWCKSSNSNDQTKAVIRGGGYKSKASDCRNARRLEIETSKTNEDLGFRLILRAKE